MRLIERDLARIAAREKVDDGLPNPANPELVGYIDVTGFERWLRRRGVPHVHARRSGPNEWVQKQDEIFQQWHEAGFKVSPKPEPTGDTEADRNAVDGWIEVNRIELIRCLEEASRDV